MWAAVARKELLNHLASFRFWAGAVLTIVLTASSTLIAARDYNLRLDAYRERVAAQARELAAVSVYSFLQPVVVRPPEPLSVLDQGFDARLGTDVTVHLFSIPDAAAGGQRGNELLVSLPAVDLTTIVAVVLGLLALLLTHDAVVGEREAGMLRAVLAHRVPRQAVLAGTFAGGLAALCLPLFGGLLVSLALFSVEVREVVTPDRWLRVAGLAGAYIIYLSLMLWLGLFISAGARSASRALAVAVLVWLVTAVVLPAVAWAVAGDLVTTHEARRTAERRSAELEAAYARRLAADLEGRPMRSAFSGHTAISYTSGENRAVRYRFGSAAYYAALADAYRFEVEAGLRHAEETYMVRQRAEDRLRAGERLGTALAAVSPAFLLDRLSESFAGTSIDEHDRFLAACRTYRLELLAYLRAQGAFSSWRWFTDDPPDGLRPWPRYLGRAPEEVDPAEARQLFSRLSEPAVEARVRRDREAAADDPARRLELGDLPPFSYRSAGFLGSLRRATAEAVALLALNGLAAAAAWLRFRRIDLG